MAAATVMSNIQTNNKLVQYTTEINREYVRENLFSPYMGTDATSIIRLRNEAKKGGEQIRNSYDQGEAILAWHRQQKALSEIGDPKTYRQKLKAELLADPEFRKEFGEALRGQAARQPSSVTSLPNLARAPGSASGPRDDWPTTDAEIFAEVTRRRA